jgi:hypothetical protein
MPPPSEKLFPLDPSKPVIPVYVLLKGPRGQQFIRMALDTGATYTIAPVGAIRAIGYDPATSHDRIEFIAAGSLECKPMVTVDAAQALGVRIPRLRVVCHDLPPQSPVRGLLGLNFLTQMSLHLDFPHHVLRVTHTH